MKTKLFDSAVMRTAQEALDFIGNVVESSTEYSVIGKDLDGKILLWNEGARRLYGYEPEEVVGRANSSILHAPEDVRAGKPREILQSALQNGKWEGTISRMRKNGERFTARVVITPRRDSAGRAIGYLLISKDISDEIRLTEELKATQFYTRSLIESNIDALMTTDPLGIITDVNRQMEALTGYGQGELIGTPFKTYFTDPKRAEAGIRLVLHEGKVTNYELTALSRDRRMTVVSYNASTFRDAAGRLQGVFAAARDVTEQKKLEGQRRDSQAYNRGLIEASVDGLITVDPSGTISDVNEQMCRMSGYQREELMGTPFADYFLDAERATAGVTETFDKGVVTDYVLTLTTRTGHQLRVSFNASVFRDPSGEVRGIFASARDITEQAGLQAQVIDERAYNRGLIEASVDGLVTVDDGMRITDVNETLCRMAGRRRNQLIGTPFPDYFTERERADDGVRLSHFVLVGPEGVLPRPPPAVKDGLFARLLAERHPVRLTAGRVAPDLPAGHPRVHDRLAVPVLLHGQPVGGLYFADRPDGEGFDEGDERLAGTLAVHLAVAHERVRLVDELQRHAASLRLEALERQRAEAALQESEARFRALVQNSTDIISVLDGDGKVKYSSPSGEAVLGHRIEEQLERDGLQHVHPGDLEAVREALAELMRRPGASASMQVRVRHADGSWHVLDATGRNLLHDPAVQGIVINSRDITERRRAEEERQRVLEALQHSNATLQALIDTLPAGVVLADASGAITLSNRVADDLFGGPPTGDTYGPAGRYTVHRPDDGAPFPPEALPLPRALAGQTAQGIEIVVRREGGGEAILLCAGRPVRDAAGRITGAVASLQDITERRRIEKELHTADKLEAIGVLAGGIAHDFNNLLTGIVANLSLLRLTAGLTGKPLERLGDAERAGLRAKDLTQRLLTFAKGGAPIRKATRVGELIRDSAEFALSGSNVRPEFEIAADLWPAEVDPGQIGQVIQNLVLNAQQAMPQGGTVRIRAENMPLAAGDSALSAGPYLRISVADHGPGIPAHLLTKIFDPFFTTKPNGSGLGLATCYSIVHKHGGHIAAQSRPGLGTTFSILLPAYQPESLRPPAPSDADSLRPMSGQGRVLVMDDEQAMRETVREILTELGYEVEVTPDGAEAVERYRQALDAGRPFDVVLLDLTVPGGMGGREAIRRLTAMDPEVRALVSSGYSNDPVMTDFREHGFRAVIAKPYTVAELSRAVREVSATG